jgi:hypothetical protein
LFLTIVLLHSLVWTGAQSCIVGRSNNTSSKYCTYSTFAQIHTTTSKLHCFHALK